MELIIGTAARAVMATRLEFTGGKWMSSLKRPMLIAFVLAMCGAAVPPTAAAEDKPANMRLAQVAAEYSTQHPHDYVGLERAIVAAGGDSVSFAVAGHGSTSAIEAQQRYEQALRYEQARGDTRSLRIPPDSFDVSGTWYHIQDQTGEWWNATGTWNFRDDYVNGSDPGDASGLAAEVPECWVNDGEQIFAADYQGNRYRGPLIRKNAGLTESVYDVDDATSGFALLTDNGTHTISFKRHSPGCEGQPLQARYYYEHNQDGNAGGWSFNISIAGFSVGYSSAPPPALQKASQVFRT
ncbi:MAG: hypothetical protein ACRDUV_16655 [Pseudonocardiaceae bacterium]